VNVETMSRKIDVFLAMIQAGNGWYAMAVGLGVVFVSLVLVSVVISVTGRFFRRRAERAMVRALPPGTVPDAGMEPGDDLAELEQAAAAVAVALALDEQRREEPRDVPAGPSGYGEGWRLAGRAMQHAGRRGAR